MSIRPIDMQVMLPKLAKMNQVKPKVIHRDQNEQHMAQNINQQDVDKKMHKVSTFEQKEEPKVRDEEKRQNRGNRQGKDKKNSKDDSEDENTKDKIRHIDIRI